MSVLDIDKSTPVTPEYLVSKGFQRCSVRLFRDFMPTIWYEYKIGRVVAMVVSLQQNMVEYRPDLNSTRKWVSILDTQQIELLINLSHNMYDHG